MAGGLLKTAGWWSSFVHDNSKKKAEEGSFSADANFDVKAAYRCTFDFTTRKLTLRYKIRFVQRTYLMSSVLAIVQYWKSFHTCHVGNRSTSNNTFSLRISWLAAAIFFCNELQLSLYLIRAFLDTVKSCEVLPLYIANVTASLNYMFNSKLVLFNFIWNTAHYKHTLRVDWQAWASVI